MAERCKRFTRRMGICGKVIRDGICLNEPNHAKKITLNDSKGSAG